MNTPPSAQQPVKKPARVIKARTSQAIAKRKHWRSLLIKTVSRCRTSTPGPSLDTAKNELLRIVPRVHHWYGARANSVLRAVTVRYLTGAHQHD